MPYIYGIHAVESIIKNRPAKVIRLFLQERRNEKRLEGLRELAIERGINFNNSPIEALNQMVDGKHQGAVVEVRLESKQGSLEREDLENLDQLIGKAHGQVLLLILDGVTDPQNLGACLRSAEAAGATAVIIPKDKSAGITAVVQKVASGAAEIVPVFKVTNLVRVIKRLKQQGIWIYGTAGQAATEIYDCDLRDDVALVLGSEGTGLRRLTRENCDDLIRIPMFGSVQSLNVSAAAAVCMFEAVRQRRRE